MILASGQGLTTLVGLLSAAVLARLFSKHDYATYRQTLLAYTFAAPFVMLGFDRSRRRRGGHERRRRPPPDGPAPRFLGSWRGFWHNEGHKGLHGP